MRKTVDGIEIFFCEDNPTDSSMLVVRPSGVCNLNCSYCISSDFKAMPCQYVTPLSEIKRVIYHKNIKKVKLCGNLETTLAPEFENTYAELIKMTRYGIIVSNFIAQTPSWWRKLLKSTPLDSTVELIYTWHTESDNLKDGIELEKSIEAVKRVRPDLTLILYKQAMLNDITVAAYKKQYKRYPEFFKDFLMVRDLRFPYETHIQRIKELIKECPDAPRNFSCLMHNPETTVCTVETYSWFVGLNREGTHWFLSHSTDINSMPTCEQLCATIPYKEGGNG